MRLVDMVIKPMVLTNELYAVVIYIFQKFYKQPTQVWYIWIKKYLDGKLQQKHLLHLTTMKKKGVTHAFLHFAT